MCNCGGGGNNNYYPNNNYYYRPNNNHRKGKKKCKKCCKNPKGKYVKNVFFTSSSLNERPLYPITIISKIG